MLNTEYYFLHSNIMSFRIVRGMKDLHGLDMEKYNYITKKSMEVGSKYGYKMVGTPILEYTDVFLRSIGDETDVVSKEMYTFDDRGGESVTLRPEGTAGIIRSIVTEKMTQSFPLKLMYYGQMFRYDRPQKGRYRQFHQIGFEHLGEKTPYVDAIMIAMSAEILNSVGVHDFEMIINTLGDSETKDSYVKAIVKFFSRHEDKLSDDSKRRLVSNPLRILDSKDNGDREICSMAPLMCDYLSKDAGAFFEKLCKLLDLYGTDYKIDNFLVRGLDYYSHTVFEIQAGKNIGAIGGGGRYDSMLREFGGPDVSGIGFAYGAERIMTLIDEKNIPNTKTCNVAVIPVSEEENDCAFKVLKELHDNGICAEFISVGSISKKMKIADRLNSDIALIIGESEKNDKTVTVKFMNHKGDAHAKSVSINRNSIIRFIRHAKFDIEHIF